MSTLLLTTVYLQSFVALDRFLNGAWSDFSEWRYYSNDEFKVNVLFPGADLGWSVGGA